MLVLPQKWDGSIGKYISMLSVCCLFGVAREKQKWCESSKFLKDNDVYSWTHKWMMYYYNS